MKTYSTALIEGAIAGNQDKFEELLQCCMQNILHLAILHSNKQEAEDIVQDVAIVLYKKINTLTNPLCFQKWLSQIVCNASLDHMRKVYKLRERVEYEEDIEEMDIAMENIEFLPEKYVENIEMRSAIIEEINALPKTQEICMSYYYLEEFKRADIAEITGLTPRQVSTALNNGKQTLKKMLEERFGKSFAYSVTPVGAIPALARVFAVRRDEMVSMEWCEEVFKTVVDHLNTPVVAPRGNGSSVNFMACTIAAVAVVGVAVYVLSPGGEEPMVEMPPVLEEVQVEEPLELEPEEVEREIRTVADMIGEDEAELLTWLVDSGTTAEEWDGFVQRIGADSERQATSVQYVYTTYVLEKQNKRLLLAMEESFEGQMRIRYLFGDRDEPEVIMGSVILLFNE